MLIAEVSELSVGSIIIGRWIHFPMRMELTERSETSAINVTWTPRAYPKDNKLQGSSKYVEVTGLGVIGHWDDGCG